MGAAIASQFNSQIIHRDEQYVEGLAEYRGCSQQQKQGRGDNVFHKVLSENAPRIERRYEFNETAMIGLSRVEAVSLTTISDHNPG